MADSTINGLTALTGANVDNTADQFAIWDNSENTTKKITRTELLIGIPSGTQSSPSVTPSGDSNTGIYFPSADNIAFSTGGGEKVRIDSGGNLCVGTPSAKNPSSGRGNVTIEGTSSAILNLSVNNQDTGYIFHDGTNIAFDNKVDGYVRFSSNNLERLRVKATGQTRFVPLSADPGSAEAGDVYYNSSTNKLRCYNGTTWNDLF